MGGRIENINLCSLAQIYIILSAQPPIYPVRLVIVAKIGGKSGHLLALFLAVS